MTELPEKLLKLPIWNGPVTGEPLKGGLSNEAYVASDGENKYVVRFCSDIPVHHVMRDHEAMVSKAVFQAGLAPELMLYQPGVMVFRFIESTTLTAAYIKPDMSRLVQLIKRFHTDVARLVRGPARIFWVFHVLRDYADTLQAGNSRFADKLSKYLKIADQLEAKQVPLPIIFSHNDLLPANFIDDGKRLLIIDFEYAAFSTPMFDLAGLASNAGFDPSEDEELLAMYFGRKPDTDLICSHAAMKCASLLREAMWSMVSEIHLDAPGIDYAAYSDETMQLFEKELAAFQAKYGKLKS